MKKKNPPMARVEPGAFGSLVSMLPIELLGYISTREYLINIDRKHALRILGKFLH